MNSRKMGLFAIGVVLVLVVAFIARGAVQLKSPESQGVLFRDAYTLTGVMNDPLVVIGDQALLAADSTVDGDAALVTRSSSVAAGVVNGDLTLIGSDLSMQGKVSGDVALLGTNLVLDGRVGGDVVALGSTLTIDAGTQVAGDIFACVGTLTDNRPESGNLKSCNQIEGIPSIFGADGNLTLLALKPGIGTVIGSLLLAGFAILSVIMFPRQVQSMRAVAFAHPIYTGTAGVMAALLWIGIAAGGLLLLAFIPVVGAFLLLLLVLSLLVVVILSAAGWVALAFGLGDAVLRRVFRQAQPPLLATFAGTVLLFALWHVLLLVPSGGVWLGLVLLVFSLLGLGAALVTRLGWRR
ncbi:MAG: hypothetical protein H6672_21240 [Anaerolineaceae bacterium]|nr:hypothetical protein [Anaerolineaceae bacterium]